MVEVLADYAISRQDAGTQRNHSLRNLRVLGVSAVNPKRSEVEIFAALHLARKYETSSVYQKLVLFQYLKVFINNSPFIP